MVEASITVVGVNKDTVTIAGPNAGAQGIWLASEMEGFYDPEIKTVTKAPGNRPGTRFVSHRILERTLIFNVTVLNDDNGSWSARDSRWRKLWAYDNYTQIKVQVPGGRVRTLQARLEEIKVDTKYDPHVNAATDIQMTVVADDPFWYEEEFTSSATVPGTYTFNVASANPTSNPVFPVWVLEGGTTWTIPDFRSSGTVDITLPALASGENIVVDTDPGARQLMSESDTPVWARMNGVRFRGPLPPFKGRLLATVKSSVSGKTAQLRLKRPFNRPWGDI